MTLVARCILLSCLLMGGVLVGDLRPASSQVRIAQVEQAEIVFWQSVRDSNNPSELEAYLKAYPKGRFAPLATIRLNKLKTNVKPQKTSQQPAAQPSPSGETRTEIPPAPRTKPHAWLGVLIMPVNAKRADEIGLAAAAGIEIQSLYPFGPAKTSGLKPHDVIVSADGTAVIDLKHFAQLVSRWKPSEAIELVVLRDGKRLTAKVTLGDFFNDLWGAAHNGDAFATYMLGMSFARGNYVERDQQAASIWLRRAAAGGNTAAMNSIGFRYSVGLGVQRDDREAVRWYRKAADAGNTKAMVALGEHYQKGRGVERNLAEGARWIKLAADKGDIAAAALYGHFLMFGNGVEKNASLAVDYSRRAAQANIATAYPTLGVAYYYGRGVTKDHREAVKWFRRAAEHKMTNGFFGLALMYQRGEGGLKKNLDEAIRFYRKAAEAGHRISLDRLKALNATVYDPEEVQQLLSELGFDPGPINGRPGRKTAQAIRAFQKSRGLPVDGKASLRLVGQLRAALKTRTTAKTKTEVGDSKTAAKPAVFDALKNLEKLD